VGAIRSRTGDTGSAPSELRAASPAYMAHRYSIGGPRQRICRPRRCRPCGLHSDPMNRLSFLFQGRDLRDGLAAREAEAKGAALQIPADHALARSPDELAAELFERYTVERLELDWDNTSAQVSDTQVDVSHDVMRAIYDRSQPAYVPGSRLTYHVPFTGHAWLFSAQPNIFGPVHPQGEIRGGQDRSGDLLLWASAPADSMAQLKGQVEAETERVKKWVDYVNMEVDVYNAQLRGLILAAVEQRRRKVLGDKELLASLNMPVRRREDAAPTYVPDSLRRKVPPTSCPQSGRAGTGRLHVVG
jgi:hypothetical protein